jgi:hypothetical protein
MEQKDFSKRVIEWVVQEPGCAWIPYTMVIVVCALLSGIHGWLLILPLVGLNTIVYTVLTCVRPDREGVQKQGKLLNRKQLAWLILMVLMASILLTLAILSFVSKQSIWIQTQGPVEAIGSMSGSIWSLILFFTEWSSLFFRKEIPVLLVIPRIVWTLMMCIFVIGTIFIFVR